VATSVVLSFDDGRTLATDVDRNRRRFWAVPIKPGDNPSAVSSRTADGTDIERFDIG
jgi:hypothetical protein